MKNIYTLIVLLVVMIPIKQIAAQNTKPVDRYESNWQLNAGIGYGTYYGDMSRYNIRNFEDVGYLRNFFELQQELY